MNVKELRQQCKELKIKGFSKMTKAELESAIYLKQVSNWYSDVLQGCIVIEDDNLDEAELNIENLQ
jgi:hypothetical protein